MSKTKEQLKQKAYEEAITNAGRMTAEHWQRGSLKGTQEQVSGNIEILKHAAVNVLAAYAFNSTKIECCANPVDLDVAVSQLVLDIRAEIEYLKTAKVEFHDIKDKKND